MTISKTRTIIYYINSILKKGDFMEDIINSLKDDAKYLLELAKFNKIKTKIEIDLLKNIEFSEELIKKLDGARDKVDVFLDKMAYIKKSIRDTSKISERFNQVKFGRMISDARNEEREIRDLLNQIDNKILNFLKSPHIKVNGIQRYSRQGLFAIEETIMAIDNLEMPNGNKNHLIEYMGERLQYLVNIDKIISLKRLGKYDENLGENIL